MNQSQFMEFDNNNPATFFGHHVLHVVGDPVGGVRLHVHTLIRELNKQRIKLSYAVSIKDSDAVFRSEIDRLDQSIENYIPLNVEKKPHYSDFRNVIILYRYVKEAKVTIIHGHGAKGGLYARLVGCLTGAKCIYTPHGGTAHDMFTFIESLIYKNCERLLSCFTDFYIYESKYTKDSFASIGVSNDRCRIIPNGLDIQEFISGAKLHKVNLKGSEGDIKVGVFGMLREQKGQIYLLRAIKELGCFNNEIALHVFGDGPDKSTLLDYVEQEGLKDKVYFYGDVLKVGSYMKELDVIAIPSLFESFGYVALEAMLLNKPVVASGVGGLVEVLAGWRCRFSLPKDVDSIVESLRQVIEEGFLYKDKETLEMKQKEYSSERMSNEVISVYAEALK